MNSEDNSGNASRLYLFFFCSPGAFDISEHYLYAQVFIILSIFSKLKFKIFQNSWFEMNSLSPLIAQQRNIIAEKCYIYWWGLCLQPEMKFKNWTILLQQVAVGICMAQFKIGMPRVSAVSLAELYICSAVIYFCLPSGAHQNWRHVGIFQRLDHVVKGSSLCRPGV